MFIASLRTGLCERSTVDERITADLCITAVPAAAQLPGGLDHNEFRGFRLRKASVAMKMLSSETE